MIDFARPKTEVKGFRIEGEIGRGGMGVVYLAEQLNLGRKVALKVIAPTLSEDPAFRARFEREARLAASLDHPNIVPVFEAGDDGHLLYLAMRYVSGTDLGAVLASEGALSPGRAGHILNQLGAALDAAHRNGLIHRDVKPGNILLSDGVPRGHVYLTDFGLTKETGDGPSAQLTNSGQFVGTVDYVAPEQLDNRPIDARTDVYSLGCVLFQLLSGRVPFEGTSLQKMWGHGSSAPPSLRGVDHSLAARFDGVIARAMAKEPSARYPSAGDLGRAALAAVHGRAVSHPERSVAAGFANGNLNKPPPWARDPVPSLVPAPALTAAVPVATPQKRRRPRFVIPAVALTVLLLAVAAGAFLASRGDDSDSVEPASGPSAARQAGEAPSGTAGTPGRAADTPTPTEASTSEAKPPANSAAVSYREFTPSTYGYSTEIPAGPGWSSPSETEPTPGQLYRTTINGPNGLVVVIDYTPLENAEFGQGAESTRVVDQAAFGSATEYVFSGGRIPQCQRSKCVDYIVNDTSRGSGYGILAGGSDDFALARRVAKRITDSLVYSDL